MSGYWSNGDEITANKLNQGNLIQSFTFGETIAVNDALYLKGSDGKVYKTDADFNDERIYNFIGFAKEAGNANDVKLVQIDGVVEGFSGLTIGVNYYLSGTPGAISSTPGTYIYKCGLAISSTDIMINGKNLIIPSNTLRFSNPTEKITGSTTYVKLKEIKVGSIFLDKIRVSFDMKNSNSANYAYGRIYKNNSAIGTEYNYKGDYNYHTYSDDLGPFKKDDLIQVYGKHQNGTPECYIKNLNLYYDEAFIPPVGFTNQDP